MSHSDRPAGAIFLLKPLLHGNRVPLTWHREHSRRFVNHTEPSVLIYDFRIPDYRLPATTFQRRIYIKTLQHPAQHRKTFPATGGIIRAIYPYFSALGMSIPIFGNRYWLPAAQIGSL